MINCAGNGQNPSNVIQLFPAAAVASAEAAIERAVEHLRATLREIIKAPPSSVEEMMNAETRLHQEVAQKCLDPFVGHLLQEALESPVVRQKAAQVVDRQVPFPRLQRSDQPVNIVLFGGSTVGVKVPYILNRPPRGPGRPRKRGRRGKGGNGLYPTLEVLGLQFRVTPALAEEVARLTTLEPIDDALQMLNHRGIFLDRKVVDRISNQIGARGLAYREFLKTEVENGYRGDEAAGKRLVISADGGRIRTRVEKKSGRKKKNGRRGYEGEWREPKAFTVYEIDDKGRKKKIGGLVEYDGTMGDADAIFMRLAVLLCSIGAHLAQEWAFIADGADWIWDRVPKLIADVGYSSEKVTQILDYYHAIEYLYSLAGEIPRWSENRRAKWVKHMKKLLKKGKVEEFLGEVENLGHGRMAETITKRLKYFTKHKERMVYSIFKKRNLPLGSGAMESCIRRLVNLRFKGNGIFWKIETLECRLHLRAQLLSGKWADYIPLILGPKAFWDSQTRMKYELQEAA